MRTAHTSWLSLTAAWLTCMTSSFNISRWNITNLSLFFNMCMNQFSSPNILVWGQINTQPSGRVGQTFSLHHHPNPPPHHHPNLIALVILLLTLLTITRGLLGTSRSDSTTRFSSPSVPLLTGTSQWATLWRLSNVRGDNDDHYNETLSSWWASYGGGCIITVFDESYPRMIVVEGGVHK